ncbi:MAG: Fe-Mn family superoxide dismutase [Candidatus Paceibacterota bacterium]
MATYTPREFEIPELDGISQKTIKEHLGLYQGYVTNTNKIQELIDSGDVDDYALKETQRRLAFEFDGMRNHEYYFSLFEGGSKKLEDSPLLSKIDDQFGLFDDWLEYFKGSVAKTRGVGWAMLSYDTHTDQLLNYWVDEQHLGHLTGVQPIITLDMWEHSYCMDYAPSEKGQYIDAFFENINWETAAGWYDEVKN